MAAGDLTCSTPVECVGLSEVESAINALNLAAATDFVFVVPLIGRSNCFWVFKVERAAA